jgi:hypothetical protein
VSTINGVFILFLLLRFEVITFLPDRRNFASGFKSHKKIRFGVKTNLGDPSFPWIYFYFFCRKTEKCIESQTRELGPPLALAEILHFFVTSSNTLLGSVVRRYSCNLIQSVYTCNAFCCY